MYGQFVGYVPSSPDFPAFFGYMFIKLGSLGMRLGGMLHCNKSLLTIGNSLKKHAEKSV